ncbi:hypothetical protein [Luteirhabdus pelagi]|uniref:hypothetical protein n=1 Tax=Luteirhabdus pelagi TaxID=2792783 RepID=UPI00193AADDE|nr:hypothetical protein [Luteirhabdus pelagi]
MEKPFKKRRFKDGIPFWFMLHCILNYNFKSFKRFLIYIFHFSGFIDIRKKAVQDYKVEELYTFLEPMLIAKIYKKDFLKIFNVSNNTFNKYFEEHIKLNGLEGRRKYTLLEASEIINEWQGNEPWGYFEAITKENMVKGLALRDYRVLANDLNKRFEKEYTMNKFSPARVKQFLEHIDAHETKEASNILGYRMLDVEIKYCLVGMSLFFYNTQHYETNEKHN